MDRRQDLQPADGELLGPAVLTDRAREQPPRSRLQRPVLAVEEHQLHGAGAVAHSHALDKPQALISEQDRESKAKEDIAAIERGERGRDPSL